MLALLWVLAPRRLLADAYNLSVPPKQVGRIYEDEEEELED